ncbi:CopY/TcrY family copper transport repressor [Lactobacillus colini]|uniref:CopY/TcrY family copper transport repressor n=1 Tax=Lactobacillus colini TaxID=1819254 RepID=A0ABS4MF88_9LACO|nr:CopY/TcrY family copper transport repressor [Lactobacillus colini]MBP2058346.1 CopY/TcrY family copper transport repressor [Lactobacillus colini]
MSNHVETNISDSEWEVMRIVWTLEKTYASQIISELQKKNDWTDSTIKTLMRRLVQKGLLKTEKDGRRFIYLPTVSQIDMMKRATNELFDRLCDMHKGEVILSLLEDSPISKSDLMKMDEVINQKEKDAPAMVPCDCLKEGTC